MSDDIDPDAWPFVPYAMAAGLASASLLVAILVAVLYQRAEEALGLVLLVGLSFPVLAVLTGLSAFTYQRYRNISSLPRRIAFFALTVISMTVTSLSLPALVLLML